ncbi:MAG: phosphomannomutase/phosphoglucomutase [Alphaproteobacteria bacterium TMED93]|nr:MAG: phosphomannomutase/phosphoglucomutase [Alphaproteobacteria bacterium TMED93]
MRRKFHDSILRAYDIRGVIGETLNSEDAYFLGLKFSSYIRKKTHTSRVVVGYDGRLSSKLLNTQLIKGLVDAGSYVTSVGVCPSPMLYYADKILRADGSIMITGSHNPSNYNGFKMIVGGKSIYGDEIQKLAKYNETQTPQKGISKRFKIDDSYILEITKDIKNINPDLKVVWDTGNGAAGNILKKILKLLPGKHHLLNSEIDGTFPSHHPDPTEEKNLKQLKKKVSISNADIGIAFDGDGDRIGIVDNKSNFISGDKLLYMFATEVVKDNPGAIIISDVKASNMIFEQIKKIGGTPLMWKTGHSFIKEKMRKTKALLAGEMSGHIFFADKYYGYDDALYASIRILKILSKKNIINNLLKPFSKLISTPEIKIFCNDSIKFDIVKRCKSDILKKFSDVTTIDGIRVNTKKGWWLIRASNTQPAIIVRCEAESEANLTDLILEVKSFLDKYGIKNNL